MKLVKCECDLCKVKDDLSNFYILLDKDAQKQVLVCKECYRVYLGLQNECDKEIEKIRDKKERTLWIILKRYGCGKMNSRKMK